MNTQKPLERFHDESGKVQLHSIFPTIQGEGIFAGEPATFIRLAGCNLRCPACDTEYTDGTQLTSPAWIVQYVNAVTSKNRLVVITGGEPFRQTTDKLVTALVEAGYRVQFETNGTLPITFDPDLIRTGKVFIMCSPKTGRIHKDLQPFISAYKYVIDADHINLLDGLPTRVLGLRALPARPHKGYKGPIYVQPMDSKDPVENDKHLQMTIKSALEFGYTFCLQVHKIINVE